MLEICQNVFSDKYRIFFYVIYVDCHLLSCLSILEHYSSNRADLDDRILNIVFIYLNRNDILWLYWKLDTLSLGIIKIH